MLCLLLTNNAAQAGTSVNVRVKFQLPHFVKAEKHEHRILGSGAEQKAEENRNNGIIILEVPVVTSNSNWNFVVIKDNKVVQAGEKNVVSDTQKESVSLEEAANNAAATIITDEQNSTPTDTRKLIKETELSYTFFAD